MIKTCFCGISERCGYQIETDMEQHDKVIYEQGYNKAIDDFMERIMKGQIYGIISIPTVEVVAKQLKGENNERKSNYNNNSDNKGVQRCAGMF